jgi:hypothetical protein
VTEDIVQCSDFIINRSVVTKTFNDPLCYRENSSTFSLMNTLKNEFLLNIFQNSVKVNWMALFLNLMISIEGFRRLTQDGFDTRFKICPSFPKINLKYWCKCITEMSGKHVTHFVRDLFFLCIIWNNEMTVTWKLHVPFGLVEKSIEFKPCESTLVLS